MSRTERITSATRAVFRMMSEISYSGFTELAPTVTPFAPAFFFAAAIATTAAEKLPGWPWWATFGIAFLVGFFAAYGLESSAFMSFGSAMKAHRHFGWRALLLPAAYLAIGITALWVVEEFATAVVGTALFLLAAVVYASRMVMIEAAVRDRAMTQAQQETAVKQTQAEADQKAREHADRQWQQQQEAAQAQRDHEARMRQMELDAQVKTEKERAKITTKMATINNNSATINTTDWRHIPDNLQRQFHKMTSGEIRETFGNLDSRKIRDWRRYSKQLVDEVVANGHAR